MKHRRRWATLEVLLASLAAVGLVGAGSRCDLRALARAESLAAFELEMDWVLDHSKVDPPGPWTRARIGWHRGIADLARGTADLAGVPTEEEVLDRLIRKYLRRQSAGPDPH